jgi:1D-myo-inositol-tetrakisphosphate 5-kinase/inositol-polyphosphate multikinase
MVEIISESIEQKGGDKVAVDTCLPFNCMPLSHQVAGHFYEKGKAKLGFLQTKDGFVLKPMQSPPRGEREHNFFKRIFASDDSVLNQDEIKLRNLLPTYRGLFKHNEICYIKMDDIANGIENPAVIDLKIGQITHDPEATIEKITRQKLKYPPVEKIGFQLLGMRVFDKKDGNFSHYDKIFGRSLSEEDLVHGLALYYQFHQTPQLRAVRETIKKFEEIRSLFEKQKTSHFYSSSLIVIYEAYLEDNINMAKMSVTAQLPSESSVRIVMADFAHVFPAENTLDKNYLYGLVRLIDHLKMLLRPDYTFKDVRLIYG